MEIFVSRAKVFKATLFGLLLTGASMFVSVKCYHNVFLESYSVFESTFRTQIIPFVVGTVGIFGFLIFGGMTLVFISRLFYTEPQVIINLEGIEDKRLRTGLIKWNEIDAVMLAEANRAQWLTVVLDSPEKYYLRLPKFELFLRKINYQQGNNSLRIRFADLDKPINEVWEFIENNIIKNREIGLHLAP